MIIDAPNPNENVFSDEFNGDVSTTAAQGTVTYTYASQLPFSNFPTNCSFRIGSSVPITVTVTNTTNHVGYFELQPSGNDISGANTVTPEELAAGTTGTLTATLSPTAAAGSAVNGTLSVIDSTDFGGLEPAIGFPLFSDFHDFAYAYTVGASSSG